MTYIVSVLTELVTKLLCDMHCIDVGRMRGKGGML